MPGVECPPTVFQRRGLIASIQMKKLHGEIRKEAFRSQLDRSVAPVLGAIEISEIQEKLDERSDDAGASGIDRYTLPKPSSRLVELPFVSPIMESSAYPLRSAVSR